MENDDNLITMGFFGGLPCFQTNPHHCFQPPVTLDWYLLPSCGSLVISIHPETSWKQIWKPNMIKWGSPNLSSLAFNSIHHMFPTYYRGYNLDLRSPSTSSTRRSLHHWIGIKSPSTCGLIKILELKKKQSQSIYLYLRSSTINFSFGPINHGIIWRYLPSPIEFTEAGQLTVRYGKSPSLISVNQLFLWAIFNSKLLVITRGYIYRMVPPSYKLVYKPHENYSYICHKP